MNGALSGRGRQGDAASAERPPPVRARVRPGGCSEIGSNTKLLFRDGPQGRAREPVNTNVLEGLWSWFPGSRAGARASE
jgi:hypothetical protein